MVAPPISAETKPGPGGSEFELTVTLTNVRHRGGYSVVITAPPLQGQGWLLCGSPKASPEQWRLGQLGFYIPAKLVRTSHGYECFNRHEALGWLLKGVDRFNLWGQTLGIQVIIGNASQRIGASKIGSLPAPVKPVPVKGHLLTHKKYGLLYPTDEGGRPTPTEGRELYSWGDGSTLNGKYFFVHGGRFETVDRYRGFDCSSFVKMALGLTNADIRDFLGKSMSLTGASAALKAGLSQVLVTDDIEQVRSYISGSPVATMLSVVQMKKHCVLVRDGIVYEFNEANVGKKLSLLPETSLGGYATPLADWRRGTRSQTCEVYARIMADLPQGRAGAVA